MLLNRVLWCISEAFMLNNIFLVWLIAEWFLLLLIVSNIPVYNLGKQAIMISF